MTERYGPGYGDEGGQRPSGRGAVTERLARRDADAREVDLTDEAARGDGDDTVATPTGQDRDDRESSGAFEPAGPAAPTADPPADAERPGSSSIFDVDERAKQEDLNRTGYEPPMAEAEAGDGAEDRSADITPTPVPVAEPSADAPAPQGLPEPAAADTPAAEAAPAAPAPATAGSQLGSLDAADIRSRFLDIQAGFIDEPRQAVEEAGRFVDDLVRQVADALQQQRAQLGGAEGSTEDLRLALRAYRQFVDRLLGLAD
jgi:hypothetical protein